MSNPNKIHAIVTLCCIAVIGFVLSFAIIAYTPLSNLIPGYPTAEVQRQQVQTSLLLDSLEHSIQRWEMYSENLRRITSGEAPIQFDSIVSRMEREQAALPEATSSKADSTLRELIDEKERFDISDKNKRNLEIEGLHFFKPIIGYVVEAYSESLHPYVLMAAKEGSRVTAVLDGTVIFTCWEAMEGWCIVLQHENGIISTYKRCGSLLKKVTDRVSAGSAIAILSEDGRADGTSPALHFELWQNGATLDPAAYINF